MLKCRKNVALLRSNVTYWTLRRRKWLFRPSNFKNLAILASKAWGLFSIIWPQIIFAPLSTVFRFIRDHSKNIKLNLFKYLSSVFFDPNLERKIDKMFFAILFLTKIVHACVLVRKLNITFCGMLRSMVCPTGKQENWNWTQIFIIIFTLPLYSFVIFVSPYRIFRHNLLLRMDQVLALHFPKNMSKVSITNLRACLFLCFLM